MILYRCSKEKFCLDHSLELKGWAVHFDLSFVLFHFRLVFVKMEVRVEDGSINSEAVTSQTQSENFVDNGWASFPEIAKREEVKRVG